MNQVALFLFMEVRGPKYKAIIYLSPKTFFTGDVMSPPNLDRLLVLPSGCGEQNLVKIATNWVVAEYLLTTDQLQDFIAVKIRNNIQIGVDL